MTLLQEVPSDKMMDRFFEAIAYLKKEKVISGIIYFLEHHKIPKSKMLSLKSDFEKKLPYTFASIDVEVYYILAMEYNISLEYLFFGIGQMKKIYRLSKNAEA